MSTKDRTDSILSAAYWKEAVHQFHDVRMLVFAALIVALRVAVKLFKIPVAAGLNISFDCYVNALGSLVYGPVMALLVGAVSDTLGCILFPSGPYFFPFIFVEMMSSFIFALFLWNREIKVTTTLLAKFVVNLVCNIIMTSVIMKWDYYVFYGLEKAEAYNIINLVRIGKNLVLFPFEAVLITLILQAAAPVIRKLGYKNITVSDRRLQKKHYILIGILFAVSVMLVIAYILWGADLIKANNIKLL